MFFQVLTSWPCNWLPLGIQHRLQQVAPRVSGEVLIQKTTEDTNTCMRVYCIPETLAQTSTVVQENVV